MVATILFALVISLAMLYIMYVVGCPVAQRFVSGLSSFSGSLKSAFYSPDKLKEALVRDDWKLYTTSWCGWSRDQLSELGGSFDGNIVCDDDTCGFDTFPTWANARTGQVVEGYLPVTKLEKLVKL